MARFADAIKAVSPGVNQPRGAGPGINPPVVGRRPRRDRGPAPPGVPEDMWQGGWTGSAEESLRFGEEREKRARLGLPFAPSLFGQTGGSGSRRPRIKFGGNLGKGFLGTFLKLAEGITNWGQKNRDFAERDEDDGLELGSPGRFPLIGTVAGSTGGGGGGGDGGGGPIALTDEEEREKDGEAIGESVSPPPSGTGGGTATPPPVEFPDLPERPPGRPGQQTVFEGGKFVPAGDVENPPKEGLTREEFNVAEADRIELERQKASDKWQEDIGRFIQSPGGDAQQEIFKMQAEAAAAQPIGEPVPGTVPAATGEAPSLQAAVADISKGISKGIPIGEFTEGMPDKGIPIEEFTAGMPDKGTFWDDKAKEWVTKGKGKGEA